MTYRMLIKSEEGKTREVLGKKNVEGLWQDAEGTIYYGQFSGQPVGWKQPDKTKVMPAVKWYVLDAVPFQNGRKTP